MLPSVWLAIWHDESLAFYERQLKLVRDAGVGAELPIQLQAVALERAWCGDLAGARQLTAEAEAISTATGVRIPPNALLRVLSLEGSEAEASALIQAVIEEAMLRGQGQAVMVAQWAAAVLYNGLARYEEAVVAAADVATNALLPYLRTWAQCELVEAAVGVGSTEVARDALAALVATTQPAATYLSRGIEARCRALLDDDDAEELYREAIKQLEPSGNRTELARAYLVYGEWLRAAGRLREAREPLRAAEELFADIGMDAFGARARAALVAAGAKPRMRALELHEELTPQEQQIARLARDGLTNSQIGAQLFLSSRTVEWHLHKVFGKLGINSRDALDRAMPQERDRAVRNG
jgi:DNA-binding NarL/FixJ family response regulator